MSAALLAAAGSGPRINVVGANVSDSAVEPSGALGAYSLQSDGDEAKTEGAVNSDLGDWITPKSLAAALNSLYECRLTGTGDAPDTGSLNTWLALGTSRAWTWNQASAGSTSFSGTIEIRLAASGAVLDSAAVIVSLDVFP